MEPMPGTITPPGDLIKESGVRTFVADVIEASRATPIIVDFWAPWCQPCRQLTPALEKVVREANGAVKLVKINIDENPQLAQQLRIQSIPTVYGFRDGRPVDAFMGALPESQLKAFVTKLVGHAVASPIDDAIAQAREALDTGDLGTAGALFAEVLNHDPGNAIALAGLARVNLLSGDREQAASLIASIPEAARRDRFVASAVSAVELAEQTSGVSGEMAEFAERVALHPEDHQARFDFALALFAADRHEDAAEAILEIIKRERNWNEGAARQQLLKFFEAWGAANPLTVAMRRRLSSILFS
ncbi:MAG: thioredoxin [Alphaproteobacteria bacterium]|nr:thioredoxin [Alphaproteobacteria bacterium]